MKRDTTTPKAEREFCVQATQVVHLNVEAKEAAAAYRKAKARPHDFRPCGGGLTLDRAVKDIDTDAFIPVGQGPPRCCDCGSEVVATVNDSHFGTGHCGACEFARYRRLPRLLALVRDLRRECSKQIERYRDDLKEDFGDPEALRERLAHWRRLQDRCDRLLPDAHGTGA